MSFDATDRVAPEKQDMPACLPMVSSMGDERATMTNIQVAQMAESYGSVWNVIVTLDGISQPTVTLEKNGVRHIYNASTFVGLGGDLNGFRISPLWDDEPFIEFSNDQWAPACIAVRNAIPRRAGFLDVRWVPDEPSLPF